MYGRTPEREYRVPVPTQGSYEERLWGYVLQDIMRLQTIRQKAAGFISKAQERQRMKQDRSVKSEPLKIGDPVLVYRNIVESFWSAKLEPK